MVLSQVCDGALPGVGIRETRSELRVDIGRMDGGILAKRRIPRHCIRAGRPDQHGRFLYHDAEPTSFKAPWRPDRPLCPTRRILGFQLDRDDFERLVFENCHVVVQFQFGNFVLL